MEHDYYQTKEFILQEYKSGNTENTIEFVKYLQQKRPGKRLAIFGDGATYHKSQEFREYLKIINQDLPIIGMVDKLYKICPKRS